MILDLAQAFLHGLMLGASYALLGLGFTLTFGVMRRLNLSYGPTAMLGVYAAVGASALFPGAFLLALAATLLVSLLVGLYVERLCFWAIREGAPLASMVSSFAIWMQLEEVVALLTQARAHPVSGPVPAGSWLLGSLLVRSDYLSMLAGALILMAALYGLLYRTRWGRAVRALAEQSVAARLMGVNVNRLSIQAFLLASAVGGLAGYGIAITQGQVTPFFGLWVTIKGLTVMVLGGLGSIPGAIAGGLILGVVEAQALWYLGGDSRDLAGYALLFSFLVLRPRGLLRTAAAADPALERA